jgi:hypothetical protein
LGEVTLTGAEDDAAPAQYRRFDVAFAGTPGAFLAVQLMAAALHVGPALDGSRARSPSVSLRGDNLVQNALFDRNVENRVVQFGLRDDISGSIYYINNGHSVPR